MSRWMLITIFSFLALVNSGAENPKDLGHGYSRQGEFILFKGQRIDQAGRHDFAKFRRHLRKNATMCQKVDAASFQALSEPYARDKNMVYYKWISPGKFWVIELPKADPPSFEVIGFNLARDKNHVYWYGDVLADLDEHYISLFVDENRYFLYVPYRGEVYVLEPKGESLRVTRPIMVTEKNLPPGQVALSTAELANGRWIKQVVQPDPKIPGRDFQAEEAHVLKIYLDHFEKAWKLIREREKEREREREEQSQPAQDKE